MSLSSLRAGAAELALTFAALFLGAAVLTVIRGLGLWPSSTVLSGPAITGLAVIAYRVILSRLIAAKQVQALPPATKQGLGKTVLWTLLGLAAALAGSIILGWALDAFSLKVQEQPRIVEIVEASRKHGHHGAAIMLGVSAIACAPIVEELLFRGLLFRRLNVVSGRAWAYVLSALCFAAIHGNLSGLIIYSWLGLVFAYACERTGRVGSSIVIHMGNNAFAFANLMLGSGY